MWAPPRALCELHSGPHVKKIVLRLRSKKAEISKRLWPRNRKNGKRIYSYYGLQTRYAVWRSRSHYCVVSLNHPCMRDQITHCRALAAAPDLPTGQTTPRTSRGRPCRHGLALKPYFSGRRRGCAPAAPIQNTVGGGGRWGLSIVTALTSRTSNHVGSRESFFFSRVCGPKSVHTKKEHALVV